MNPKLLISKFYLYVLWEYLVENNAYKDYKFIKRPNILILQKKKRNAKFYTIHNGEQYLNISTHQNHF